MTEEVAGVPVHQMVSVSVALAGRQDTSVAATRPMSDSAAIGVRVGGVLVYMHDQQTVFSFAAAWARLSGEARRLPIGLSPSEVTSLPGMKEPAVIVDAVRSPVVQSWVERPPGKTSALWVRLGRVAFRVGDLTAFGGVSAAFRSAPDLVASTFPVGPRGISPVDEALDRVRRVFLPPRPLDARRADGPASAVGRVPHVPGLQNPTSTLPPAQGFCVAPSPRRGRTVERQ